MPVYAVSGWADNYSEAVPRLLAGLSVPARGLVGPWAHSYPHDVTVAPVIGWLQEVVRWLDHWLKGRDTGIMDEPALRVWMQEPMPPATCYTHRPGRWVGEETWPSPRIADLALQMDGAALTPPPSPFFAGPGAPATAGASTEAPRAILSPLWVGLTAGEVGRYGEDADWPPDQRMDDGGALVWLSPPLTERLEILGAPRVTLQLSADKPVAQVCLRLNDVSPEGPRARVTVGLLNLTHRDSHEDPTPLTPGQVYTVTVELDDIAQAFPPGHQIGLSLSTSYYPIAHPGPEMARVTIHGGTLHLPQRPPRPEDAQLRPFDPPTQAPRTPERHETVPTLPRRVTMDLLSGRYAVDFPRWTYKTVMEDVATTVTSSGHVRHEITEGDPLSAETFTEYRVTLERHGVIAGHHSKGRLSCTATHFRLETELTVSENGTTIFQRQWDERFARDCQ